MIPILYEKDETAFTSNGLGRLRDCISCVVTEERNGIYECDFEYPIDGVNYDRIQCGRIIVVEHDESNDVQPFDIVGYSRPINGVVTFHCVHVSYRQTAMTVSGTNINSLADAFTLLGTAQPSNPFNYWTDKDSTGYMASGDGVPHSVRSILGGMEGSILDAYGGEYEWDTWTVKLWASRGSIKNFTIRYGVNLTDYSEDTDYTDTYTSVIPYWVGQDSDGNALTIIGDRQDSGYPPFNGSERCIPIDVTDKFDSEDGQPTKAQIEAEGLAYITANQPFLPSQTIKVDFVRISDSPEYAQFKSLQTCKLCDSVNVMFPRYNVEGTFKIVKTEYDVLNERYLTLELGTLSISLATALGINSSGSYYVSVGGGGGGGTDDYDDLTNKPKINNVTLSGNKTTSDLGINIPTITDTYSGTSSDGMSGKAVKGALETLDGTVSGSAGAGKTLTAFSQTDGKVSATFGNISITKSQVSDFPSLATVATSGSYNDLSNKPTIPTITDTYSGTSSNGMSGKAVKSAIDALDGTISGSAGTGKTLSAFSQTDGKVSATFSNISITKSQVSDFPSLATVATSGSYSDLSNKPSIPTITDTYSGTSSNGMSGKAVKSAIDALDGTVSGSAGSGKTLTAFSQTDGKVSATFGNISITKSQVSDFPSLATVATSGSYTDLTDKPTIPTVNNATLTIQKNGNAINTFTANASSNVTANIVVHDVPSGGSSGQVLAKSSNTDYALTWVNQSGGGSGTDVPTADTVAEFDSTAHMNSTDMTTGVGSELEDFIDGLNVSGNNKESATATKVGSYYSSGTITAYKCCGCVTVKLDGLALSTLSARTTVATLPTGFRPAVEVYSIIHGTTRGILVTSSGNVQIESGTSGTYWASITYSAWN